YTPTRKNGEYTIQAHLLRNKAAFVLDLAETETNENLTTGEWSLVAALGSGLQPVEESTTAA
ncbi:hypothetical protein HPB47_017888, partial [Ixodes persulcatus]